MPEPTPSTSSTPSAAPIEFSWKGRLLNHGQVGRIYLVGSAIILTAGILLNWALTDGYWYNQGLQSENAQYLGNNPYDITSGVILVISLILLGAGFIGTSALSTLKAWATAMGAASVVLGIGWILGRTGTINWTPLANVLVIATLAVTTSLILAVLYQGRRAHVVRAVGFVVFGFYWATQAMKLYASEEGDFVNAIFAMFAVFFFNYFAYHELVSFKRNEDPRALQWLAGTSFITTGVYFLTHKLAEIANWLILVVAEQTTWLLHAFGQAVVRCGGDPEGSMIYYPTHPEFACSSGGWFPIQIILACTAIQSIMIFVGGIFALKPPRLGDGVSGKPTKFDRLRPTYERRRVFALLLTVPLIYVLNLFRNVIIIWMSGQQEPVLFSSNDTAFWFSHNVIGKGGSLVALVIIAFIVFQILPELYDSIIGLLDLKERKGPLETYLSKLLGRRGGGKIPEAAPAPTAPAAPKADQAPEPHLE